jgi:hypothetical protein
VAIQSGLADTSTGKGKPAVAPKPTAGTTPKPIPVQIPLQPSWVQRFLTYLNSPSTTGTKSKAAPVSNFEMEERLAKMPGAFPELVGKHQNFNGSWNADLVPNQQVNGTWA